MAIEELPLQRNITNNLYRRILLTTVYNTIENHLCKIQELFIDLSSLAVER